MSSESEKPRITELHVRMDCNGCVQKIRKALQGIDGISEMYIDSANHKITVVGIVDPERIVKAIKKTKKIPTICSHTEPAAEASGNPEQPPPPPTEGEAPPPADPPADGTPAPEAAAPEPAPENKDAPPDAAGNAAVIHMVHDYPDSHVYREHWANSPSNMHGIRYDAPYYVTQSYSSHRPTPYISEYGHVGSPVQEGRYYGAGTAYSGHDYYATRGRGDGSQITSMFSDENPNACSIV